MSVSADMATAVTAAINAAVTAGDFSPWTFAAQRTYSPPRDLDAIQDLIVLALSSAEVRSVASRGSDQFRVTVQTAVAKKIDVLNLETSPDELDELLTLVESINDVCRAPMIAGTLRAGWQETRRIPIYDAEQLLKSGVFLSVSEHDYLTVRTLP